MCFFLEAFILCESFVAKCNLSLWRIKSIHSIYQCEFSCSLYVLNTEMVLIEHEMLVGSSYLC